MSTASNLWQRLVGAPDPRSESEIQDDIEAELSFHIEQRAREFAAKGMSDSEARAAALRQFGNIKKVSAECRRVQLGGTVMMQKVTLVLLVVLLGVVAWLSFQSLASQQAAKAEIEALHAEISHLMHAIERNPVAQPGDAGINRLVWGPSVVNQLARAQSPGQTAALPAEEATSVEMWLERFQEDASKGVHTDERALSLRQQCSSNRGLVVLEAIWPKLAVDQRFVLLDVLVDSHGEPLARGVVHLSATDADPRLVRRAFDLLRELTFINFDVDQQADYLAWYGATQQLSLDEIVEKAAPALVKQLASFKSWNETCALYSPLQLHWNLPGTAGYPEYLREARAVLLIQAWARDPDPQARVAAVRWLEAVQVDEVTARMIVMPMLADSAPRDPALIPAVCQALVSLECTWAWEPLLAELGHVMRTRNPDPTQLEAIASALAQLEGERVVPTILAWISWANSPVANEILGRTALEQLADVNFDPAHDVTWWMNWWSINSAHYPDKAETETGLPIVK